MGFGLKLIKPYTHALLSVIASAVYFNPANAWELDVYGAIDIGIAYNNISRNSTNELPAFGGSRIGLNSSVVDNSIFGFRGRSQLGNGWWTSFNLASQINVPTGQLAQSALFGYESTVGLSHPKYGSFKFGRQLTISTIFFSNLDPMQYSFGQSDMGTSFGAINTQYFSNMVQYTTPNWHGVQAGIGYSFNTGDTAVYANGPKPDAVSQGNLYSTTNQLRALSLAAQYKKGPLLALASYDTAFGSTAVTSGSNPVDYLPNRNLSNPQAWYVGLAYTAGKVVLAGAWGRSINGALSGSVPGDGSRSTPLFVLTGDANILFSRGFNFDSYMLGATWNITPDTQLMSSWQMMKPNSDLPGIVNSGPQQIISAAMLHYITPKTSIYAYASYGINFQMFRGATSTVIGSGIQTVF